MKITQNPLVFGKDIPRNFADVNSVLNELTQKVWLVKISDIEFEVWYRQPNNKWVVYDVKRTIDVSIKVDVWRIYLVSVCTIKHDNPLINATKINPIPLTVAGSQWEYAFTIQGAPDFFGGFHGDEMLQGNPLWIVDGKPLSSSALAPSSQVCNRFEMVQFTKCYNPSNEVSTAMLMNVRHIFTKDGFDLKFKGQFNNTYTMATSYAGMFPVIRSADVSTKFRYSDSATVLSCATSAHGNDTGSNTFGLEVWNDKNNIGMKIEFDRNETFFNNFTNSGGRGLWLTGDVNYNKIYPTRIFTSQSEAVTIGTSYWEMSSAKYRIFCRE